MRISNYLSLLGVAILACACENDFQSSEAPSLLSDNHATRAATNILSFKSVEEMEAQIHTMLEMEPEELEMRCMKQQRQLIARKHLLRLKA